MKRALFAGVCIVLLSGRARGQGVTVNDPASIIEEVQQLLGQAKSYALQANSYLTQVQQYSTAVQELNGFIHDPNLGAASGLLNQTGLSNSLPVNPTAIAALSNGFGSLNSLSSVLGKLSQLNGLVNSNFNTNHVYTCTDNTPTCIASNANATSIAGMQGTAQSAYQDLRTHMSIIQALRDRLATATNPKDVADAQAQLQTETLWTNSLQSQVSVMQANYQAQQNSLVQRDNERLDQSADNFTAAAKAQGMGIN